MNIYGNRMLFAVMFISMALAIPFQSASAKSISASVKKSSGKKAIFTCDQYPREILLNKASKYQKSITDAARKNRVSPNLITAVITVESCFRSKARSRAGAAGLMQLMPATGRRFGVKDRYNHAHNIMAGTKYLKFLLNRFQGDVLLASAAYNAGEGAVDRHDGVPPYRETQAYVKKVLAVYKKLNAKQQPVQQQRIAAQPSRHTGKLSLPELNHAYKLLDDDRYKPVLSFKQFL
ncbi:MAG: Membrane-bound lytic murein transglycosylase D precursor (EC [uncultured Thiotrichaceae bacterium]|uniref:Membrane-bound lytic murein transglycosylase D (EC) n=1 Tax=uncultured Thiotrichaceae bacterium TaxID=298394 RepID=A0A6S6T418_9GAMM|nr:MAG: Membrane-bound lytic murein transglycosylase D precursor (EC [uncultured Thiotrichaceae bacterium]